MENLELLKTFDESSLPDLDVVVLGALELFDSNSSPKIAIPFNRPLVVGSAGALATGRILFHNRPAVFASESDYQEVLKNSEVDGVVIVSASGSKHAKVIAESLQGSETPVVLITNNPEAPAAEFIAPERVHVLPKNREPYTYNTSTYLGMILSFSNSNSADIKNFIESELKPLLNTDFSKYKSFTFILPKEFSLLTDHVRIKFEELFIPIVWGRAYTEEEIKHAKTVINSEDELFISLGVTNEHYGVPENRLQLPLPADSSYATVMAAAYFTVGRIQAALPPYFKEYIEKYVTEASEIFGQQLSIIVE